jgi:hypothetical protein
MRLFILGTCLALLSLTRPASADLPTWSYQVKGLRGGALLHVTARLERPGSSPLGVVGSADPYLKDLRVRHGKAWFKLLRWQQGFWRLPSWAQAGCEIRYRYDVGSAARHLNSMSVAQRHGNIYHICPGAFLLRPRDKEARVVFHVSTTDGTPFLTGYRAVGAQAWASLASQVRLGPDAVFGPVRAQSFRVGGTTLTLASAGMPISDRLLKSWTARQAREVSNYFGGIPAPRVLILLLPVPGDSSWGHSRGGSGASVCVTVGRDVTGRQLLGDPVCVHELVHVCAPRLGGRWHWMEEGIATYLERVIPAQAGELSQQDLWQGVMQDFPKGSPRRGDRGLNRTDDTYRTYYGGAAYWLKADLELQIRTEGKQGLRDVMRALHRAGAGITSRWTVEHLFAASSRATRENVLRSLYAQMAWRAYPSDLQSVWQQLGLRREGSRIVLEDSASATALRQSFAPPTLEARRSSPVISATSGWIRSILALTAPPIQGTLSRLMAPLLELATVPRRAALL